MPIEEDGLDRRRNVSESYIHVGNISFKMGSAGLLNK